MTAYEEIIPTETDGTDAHSAPTLSKGAVGEIYTSCRELFLSRRFTYLMERMSHVDRVFTPPEVQTSRADEMICAVLNEVMPIAWRDWGLDKTQGREVSQ